MSAKPNLNSPNAVESEKYILGTLFRDNRCLDEAGHLRPEEFYAESHQNIFAAMKCLASKGLPVDPATVNDMLNTQGKAEFSGGIDYLRELKSDDFTTAKFEYHIQIVKRKAIQRRMIIVAQDILREADSPSDPDGLVDYAERKIMAVRDTSPSTIKPFQHHLFAVSDRIEQVAAGKTIGLPTPWIKLNELTSMRPGQLIVAAARTSQGKSILGGMCGHHVAQMGKGVLVASVEMEAIDIAGRLVSSHASIDASITGGLLKAPEEVASGIADAIIEMSKLPIFINDSPDQSVTSIASDARRLKRKNGLELVVVDYLQLLDTVPVKGQNRAEALGEVSKGLKRLAKELKVPVLALCQLNREAESCPEPMLSHLRESGAIEQDADQVWLFWRSAPGIIQLKVEKHRGGPTDRITLKHRGEFMRFENAIDMPACLASI